jgi:hypothetical protein
MEANNIARQGNFSEKLPNNSLMAALQKNVNDIADGESSETKAFDAHGNIRN